MYKKLALSFSLLLCLQSPRAHAMDIPDAVFKIAAEVIVVAAIVTGTIYYFAHYGNEGLK